MDIAIAIEGLLPAAKYRGSLTSNTQQAYDALVWLDARTKPTWQELNNYWSSDARIKKTVEDSFDMKELWGYVFSQPVSQTALVNTLGIEDRIKSFWNYPNRSAIYPFLQALVASGKAEQGDLDIIVAGFAEQGVDITTIE